MAVTTAVPKSGLILLLVNAILFTCGFALLLTAFAHTDWAHTEFPYYPAAGLNYQTYIGPWRECRVYSDDTSAPINPNSSDCKDPDIINGKLQALRSFLVIGLFFNLIGMIVAWVRFANYCRGKVVQRGLDVALIGLYTLTAVSLAVVCGLAPYILDDIKEYVENLTSAPQLRPLGAPFTAEYGNSFKIFLAAFAISVAVMLSQIIGYFTVLRRLVLAHETSAYPTATKTEMVTTSPPLASAPSTTYVDSRV